MELQDGLGVVPVAMGLFGIGEILVNAERAESRIFDTRLRSLIPSARDVRASWRPILRGTGIGFLIGLIPGVGAVVPTMISYVTEKRLSRTPERFGSGMIEGVAGPESANNAYANAALIPLFTLGIPGSPTVAVIMGAFMMNGLIPGPFLFREHGDVAWGVIASLYVGNVMLVILNLPFIPLWVAVLRVPYAILYTIILGFCVLGAYSLNGSVFDVSVMTAFGVLGYVLRKLDIPAAPMVLTMVLGPLMERALRQSLDISGGDLTILVTRPISAAALAVAVLFAASSLLQVARSVKGREAQV
jgi:putative tricarboxylic transport membrane protein